MHALIDLFTSDVGLLSLASIVFMLGMGVFYLRYFIRHMHEDEARQKRGRPVPLLLPVSRARRGRPGRWTRRGG